MSATIQDLQMQIGQLASTMSHLQSAGSDNLPSQIILNLRGNASMVSLRSGRELPQTVLQKRPRSANADSELMPTHKYPNRITRKLESDEELLKMFQKIPKYAKFLKEFYVHKRRKMKGGVELGGIVSTLTKNDDIITGAQQALPKKCRVPEIFSVPCTIGNCTFADAMLDLGASINVMPASIYKFLNFGDLEPTKMTIQLENRSVVQPLGVPEDVLVQVNELIFLADFYVLDMEDETSGEFSDNLMCILG
ncbi:hypothetical protein CR513_43511, partial [Mucuna pruriens]